MAITTTQYANDFIDLLTAQGVALTSPAATKTALAAKITDWMGGGDAIPAAIANSLSRAIADFNAEILARTDFWFGSATGGPLGDGFYPFTLTDGTAVTNPCLAKWLSGTARGLPGADAGVAFTFSTTTTDADPGAGLLRLNNATLASVTMAYVDLLSTDGGDLTAWLDALDDSTSDTVKSQLTMREAGTAHYAVFNLTAVTTATGYRKLALTFLSGSTTGFANASRVLVVASLVGNKGSIGATGGAGPTGPSAWAPPVAWGTGVGYTATAPASVVVQGGESYVCIVSHTSGTFSTDLTAGKWIKVAASGVGDTVSPATNSADFVPQWNGANSKTLKNGRAVGVASATDIPDRAAADGRYEQGANKGAANGYAGLDSGGKVPTTQLPASILGGLNYQSTWNATTNSPTIPAAASGNKGWFYKVATAGTTTIDGINDWQVGDWIVSNGATWDKVDNTDLVTAVAGLTGAISAASLKTALSLNPGTDVQAYSALLLALAGLTSAADKLPYFTGSNAAAVTTLSSFIRTLLDDVDAPTARATLGAEPLGQLAVATAKTASFTLALADAGVFTPANHASTAINATVPPNSSVAFPINTRIEIGRYGAAAVTLVAGAGVTIRSEAGFLNLNAQYSAVSLLKIGTDEWWAFGSLKA